MNTRVVKTEDICAGDVLICYSAQMENKVEEGGSGYSHVAVSINGQSVLEANSAGVRLTSVPELLEEYDQIAILRDPRLWNSTRLARLNEFATEHQGKKFNLIGMAKYFDRKAQHQGEAMARIQRYFEGTEPAIPTNRPLYFCSELVTAAFIWVGIISEAAAFALPPEAMSPEDIGKDKAFGFFCGYVKSYPKYTVPDTDYFRVSV